MDKSLSCEIVEPDAPAVAAVIWLHGLGADSSDFLDIVPQLRLPPQSGVRFIFPDAPIRPVTLNAGYPMRAWYDILGLTAETREDREGITQSDNALKEIIKREKDQGILAKKIVLAGFSQGGALALHSSLRYPEPLAGILALSTYLPLYDFFPSEASEANKNTPIMMMHGTFDMVVPEAWGQLSRIRLEELGYHIDWKTYPMQHTVCEQQIDDISKWLRKVLEIK